MSASDAQALAALVREATASGTAREVLYLGLGALPAQWRQPHHERLVEEALAPALSPTRGRCFALPNGDLVAVAPPSGPHLPAARDALTLLFAGLEAPPALALLHLPAAAAALLAIIEASLVPHAADVAAVPAAGGFPSAELAAVERALAGASLDAFLRRAPVCRLAPGDAEPETLWTELSIDTPALHAALLPGHDVTAAPVLADRLRRRVDWRLLAELAAPREAARLPPTGLTLRLGSLADPAFLRLDAALGAVARGRIVLWFAAADVLADAAGWAFARAFAAARGYTLGLDAPAPGTAAVLPPDAIGAAWVRLRWSAALPPPGAALPPSLPPDRVVLAGADRAAAIGWGWEAGITRFEGRVLTARAEA